jgi:glyoxylase I family protein
MIQSPRCPVIPLRYARPEALFMLTPLGSGRRLRSMLPLAPWGWRHVSSRCRIVEWGLRFPASFPGLCGVARRPGGLPRYGREAEGRKMNARFVHVNLVARDWVQLAAFYQQVFQCEPVPPERHLRGDWLSRATGVPDAALDGIHLRLPSNRGDGPTLEIFQYSQVLERLPPAANRQGIGHVAFEVDDVVAAVASVVARGGGMVGEVVKREIPGAGRITFAYATDPEGNIIELQQWESAGTYGNE